MAERINGILKQEFLFDKCNIGKELEILVEESIDTYNRLRPHTSLEMKTPDLYTKKPAKLLSQASVTLHKTVNVFQDGSGIQCRLRYPGPFSSFFCLIRKPSL